MKRRGFIGCAVAAVVAGVSAARPTQDSGWKYWVLVAHLGTNRNGHRYTEEILRRAATQAPGLLVLREGATHEGPSSISINIDLVGQCVEAKYTGDSLICRFRWFDRVPSGMRVTPTGMAWGAVHTPFGYDLVGSDYRLESFALAKDSAFQRATAV